MFSCEWCNKEYKALSTLNHHKKTSKKCINDRFNNGEKIAECSSYVCEFCHKHFTLKYSFEVHLTRCKQRKNNKLEELIEENAKLLKKVELLEKENKELKKKTYSKELTKKTDNKLDIKPYTVDNIRVALSEKISLHTYKKGLRNYIATIISCLVPFIITSDISRSIITILDNEGNLIKMHAELFIKTILSNTKDMQMELLYKAQEELSKDIDTSHENIIALTYIAQGILNSSEDKPSLLIGKIATGLKKHGRLL